VIQRLNVFGADINNPISNNTKKIENVLNKTHFNTNENIIRKNLLFSEGERISPLVLSDNERILRQLPFIDDARIVVVPVSDEEADIIVFTKDVYSLGGSYVYNGLKKGTV
jgi:outer membrane protein assembly factor BamA